MATLYFNGAVDGDWNNLSNWWDDSGFTTPASTLPTSGDSVIASANITSNSGSTPTVENFTITDAQMNTDINVSNSAVFYGSSALALVGGSTIINMVNPGAVIELNDNSSLNGGVNVFSNQGNGTVVFNDSSYNTGIIKANTTFNNNSALGVSASIGGDATFNDNSIKRGTVTGTITWNSSYPSDGSLTYYYNNATNDGSWATLGNWWLDEGFTIPVNSVIGLPDTNGYPMAGSLIDSVYILATINSGATYNNWGQRCKNLTVGNSNIGSLLFNISITISNSATFNNSSQFSDSSGSRVIEVIRKSGDPVPTITFNGGSYMHGKTLAFGNNIPDIILNNSYIVHNSFDPNDNGLGVSGNFVFNGNSIHGYQTTIAGNAEYNDNSIKRGSVGGTITWNSSYPSDGSLTYYFNGSEWTNFLNWWLDSSFTVPVHSAIGLPTNVDTTYIFANVGSNSGSTPTVKNLIVGDSSYANVSFDININVENSATFNNGAKFAYNGNKSLFLSENKTVTFNSNSDCYGTIDCIDGISLVNIIFNNSNVGFAFVSSGNLRGNLTLNDTLMIIGPNNISSMGVLTLNGSSTIGYWLYGCCGGYTALQSKTIILNGTSSLNNVSGNGQTGYCNITLNDTSSVYGNIYLYTSTITFNDSSSHRGYSNSEQSGGANNIYYFYDNSFNYGYISTTFSGNGNSTVYFNLGKGINGSSILGIV